MLKRWNWHLGWIRSHTDLFEALLWLAYSSYVCILDSILTILCFIMLNVWFKIQSNSNKFLSSGKDSVQPFGWFALPTLGLGATLWCAWNRCGFQASKHCPLRTWSILKESFVLIVSCNTFPILKQRIQSIGFLNVFVHVSSTWCPLGILCNPISWWTISTFGTQASINVLLTQTCWGVKELLAETYKGNANQQDPYILRITHHQAILHHT